MSSYSSPPVRDDSAPMVNKIAKRTARYSWILIGVLLIVLAILSLFVRLGLPLLAGQKSNIELRLGEYLQSPVEIGELAVRWEGLGPLLQASEVSVRDTGERSVSLDGLLIDVNLVKSLLKGSPVINELTLVGADLALEVGINGDVQVHGMQTVNNAVGSANHQEGLGRVRTGGRGVDLEAWLLNARKVGLQDARLTLIDLGTSEQIVIENLNIRAENDGRVHQLRVDAELPAELGGRVDVGIDLIGVAPTISESYGSVYLLAEKLNIRGLSRIFALVGLESANQLLDAQIDASASIELWGTWQDGRLVSVRGPLNMGNIVDTNTGEVVLDRLSTQLRLMHQDKESTILATEVIAGFEQSSLLIDEVLVRRFSIPVHSSEVTENVDGNDAMPDASAESQWRFSVQSEQVDTELTARLASVALALTDPQLATQVRQLKLAGDVNNLALSVAGTAEKPIVSLGADIEELSVAGLSSIPVFGPISGDVSLVESEGQLVLSGVDIPVQWDAVSDRTLTVDSLTSFIDIDLRDRQRFLFGADISLTDDGLETNTRVKTTLVAGASPHLDVQSRFSASDVSVLKAWLPRKQLKPAAVEWIDDAITGGRADNGSFLFFGNLSDFPFAQGEGVLRGSVDISNGEVDYLEGWPSADKINGTLELDGLTLTGDVTSADVGKFSVSQGQITIADLLLPVIELETTSSGEFEELVEFSVTGPLSSILEPAIGDLIGTGSAQMDLTLDYPLYDQPQDQSTLAASNWRPFSVNGSVFFNGNDVEFGRAELTLTDTVGAVGFNESGIVINNLKGKVLGHPVRVTGKTEGEDLAATTTIKVQGSLEANDLLAHYTNPLDQFVRGASQWQAVISAPHSEQRFAEEGVSLTIVSDLVGSQLLLPVPFNKSSGKAATLTLTTAFKDDTDEQIWEARYDNNLSALVRLRDDELEAMHIEVGELTGKGATNFANQVGVRLQGQVGAMSADGWIETLASYIDSLPSSGGTPEPILPIFAALDTDRLTVNGTDMGRATFRVNTDDVYLNLVVSNQALRGNLRYPREHWRKDIALKARLALLDWSVIDALNAPADNGDFSASDDDALDPRLLPPIEATVSDLVRDNITVKNLFLRTSPSVSGLDITTLGFAYDTMRLVGRGHWHLRDPQNVSSRLSGKHVSALKLVLLSDDFGAGFEHVGLTGVIDDGEGNVAIDLEWPGPLYLPEIARLDGEIQMDLRDGSIIPLELGAGRVIGLLSFQALPRRLKLDFKDLTDAGLAFSRITGSATINNGVADVPLLQLQGPVGVVDIVGKSDLNTQELDQTVTVLPRISTALPVIGAITGGASAGIGVLIAAGFLKAVGLDFDRIGLLSYTLEGPWQEPVLTPIPTEFQNPQ